VKLPTVASTKLVHLMTGCLPGGIPPFGSLFHLKTYLDSSVIKRPVVTFKAGLRTHSITMKLDDYLKVEKPMVVDLKV